MLVGLSMVDGEYMALICDKCNREVQAYWERQGCCSWTDGPADARVACDGRTSRQPRKVEACPTCLGAGSFFRCPDCAGGRR